MRANTDRLVGLLGDPVNHSLSPAMHNAAMTHLGLDMHYMAFEVSENNLVSALEGMASLGAVGTNITVPHKEGAFKWVDDHASSAKKAGAVNTVIFDNGKGIGHNTDITGVRTVLSDLQPACGKALVLGAGGAARGVVCALAEEGFSSIILMNRTLSRAESLKEDLSPFLVNTEITIVPWEKVPEGDMDILVNATSLGLECRSWPSLFLEELLAVVRSGKVLDMVYSREGKTPLVALACEQGIPAVGGEEVLLFQGVAAFELFTRRQAPVEIMREALTSGEEERS